jgi:hypothetical protein
MTCPSVAQRATLFRIICAWCQTVLAEGPAGAPTSHGMCDECLEKAFAHQAETETLIDAAASRE